MKHKLLALATLLAAATAATAQTEPEYRAEIGVGAGLTAYQGDFSGSLTANMQPTFTAVGRYKLNPRMAIAANVSAGKLKGASDGTDTWYPDYAEAEVMAFSNTYTDVGARFEYNFWPYGTGREYRGARPFTPFIALGLGVTYAKTQTGSVFTGNVPVGAGVRYKLAQRLNLGLEWMMHFSMSDKLDGVADPYGIKSSGMFKNTDCYSTLQLTLTYDIMAKCRTCHNDRY